MDSNQRHNEWVKGANRIVHFDKTIAHVFRAIGRHDCKLLDADAAIIKRLEAKELKPENFEVIDHVHQSYLWVLSGYEIVRTIDQRLRADKNNGPAVTELKHFFERIRVPLAKMEPSRRNRATDAPIAYPFLNTSLGVGWKVNKDEEIYRSDLSDSCLNLLLGWKC